MKKQKQEKKRSCLAMFFWYLFKGILILVLIPVIAVLYMNLAVIFSTSGHIISADKAENLEQVDMIVVLGASVHGDEPSVVLKDRLDTAIALYNAGVSDTILMTGDGQSDYYNEVKTMRKYARSQGVPKSAILTDPDGTCTYDSMVNLAKDYDVDTILVVTQKYHLYRSLYIAKKKGMTVYGVAADINSYSEQDQQEKREIAARCKDYLILLLDELADN